MKNVKTGDIVGAHVVVFQYTFFTTLLHPKNCYQLKNRLIEVVLPVYEYVIDTSCVHSTITE